VGTSVSQLRLRNSCRQRYLLQAGLSAAVLLLAPPAWSASNTIVVSATQADGFYVALEASAIRLSSAINVDMVDRGGDGRKRTTRIANQRLEQSYELVAGESAKVEFAPDRKSATITIVGAGVAPATGAASPPGATVDVAAAKDKAKDDKLIKDMIDAGREDLGVPSAPALTLLGLNPGAANVARTPKDVAASLVNGRGNDGKIQSGIAVDVSLAQLLTAFAPAVIQSSRTNGSEALAANSDVPTAASATTRRYFEQVRQRSPKDLTIARGPTRAFRNGDQAGDTDNELDLSHSAVNRIKLSLATTEVQDASDKRMVNLAYGVNYVFFDYSDPVTTFCNGKNHSNAVVQQRVKDFMNERGIPLRGDLVTPATLQQLRLGLYQGTGEDKVSVHKLSDAELAPVTAACSLTSMERLAASAAMVGFAHGYKLPDGAWGARSGTGRTVWGSYLTPGLHVGSYFASEAQAQAVLHAKFVRGGLVANPALANATQTASTSLPAFVKRDSNQMTLRLRAASTRATGWLEYTHSKNTTGGKAETTRRQALGFEWKLSEGIWLVGAGGSERSSLTGSKTTPFLTTNIRFGGAPGVPAALGATQ
jgi:hypothetical protein